MRQRVIEGEVRALREAGRAKRYQRNELGFDISDIYIYIYIYIYIGILVILLKL